MAITDSLKNAMLNQAGTMITHMWLSDVAGASAPANQVGSKQAVSWNAASGGALTLANSEVFNLSAGDTVRAICLGLDDGTAYIYFDVTVESYSNNGSYTVNSLTVNLNES